MADPPVYPAAPAPAPADAPAILLPAPTAPPEAYLGHALRNPLWVFGYGSLMWNPGFPNVARKVVRIYGYHRRLCIASHRYRGTPERPGLVLGLERGGCCWGMAFHVTPGHERVALEYLWAREMPTLAYRPCALTAYTAGNSRDHDSAIPVLAFVAQRNHVQYCGRLDDPAMAQRIATSAGHSGSNLDYLRQTVSQLHALGVPDHKLDRLLQLTLSYHSTGAD